MEHDRPASDAGTAPPGPPDRRRVAVVTVNYRTEARIRGLLDALRNGRSRLPCPVVVVSNSGPTAGIAPEDSLSLLVAEGNVGYGRGCNLGAATAPWATYLAFVNPDVAVSADVLHHLCDLLDVHPELGLVAGFTHGTAQLDAPTGRLVDVPPDRSVGPLFVIRAELFRTLGGFDERIFLWFEDTDLLRRVVGAGRRFAFADGIVVRHVGGASYESPDGATRAFLTRAWLTSHAYYKVKWSGRLAAAAWSLGCAAWNLASIVARRPAERPYVDRSEAVRFALRLFPRILVRPGSLAFDGARFRWW